MSGGRCAQESEVTSSIGSVTMSKPLSLGLDFGTESVRALLVDLEGRECSVSVVKYPHGQLTEMLPGTGEELPPDFALQYPKDWIESAVQAVHVSITAAGASPEDVVGIGVDFTSCTMLPTLTDGTPLCMVETWQGEKYSWPKLWKHHGALSQTERINKLAKERNETWLNRYGGIIGLEWFFPKICETCECAPEVYDASEVWVEAGDWFVWQLVGGDASQLPRSTCQAGYKGIWSREEGYPSKAFLKAFHPKMEHVVSEKMPGRILAPGEKAGGLTAEMAKRMGLKEGIPVSAAIIDAHAGVPGSGASEPDTLVMVMGTSSCHMLNSAVGKMVPGVAGVVKDGILPGYYGYETGQAAVGDAFEWVRRLLGSPDFDKLSTQAAQIPAGSDGVRSVDWFNGCRTPLMDGSLTGAFTGLTLNHEPAHLFRSVLEGSACGLKWIVQTLRDGGVPVRRFVATGGLPHSSPLFIQICADVLNENIVVPESKQGPALGAAILGALAGGVFPDANSAIKAMTQHLTSKTISPNPEAARTYERVYSEYLALTAEMSIP